MKNEEYIDINKIAELKGLKSNRSLRLAIQKGKYILNTYLDFKEQLAKFGGTINNDFLEFYKTIIG